MMLIVQLSSLLSPDRISLVQAHVHEYKYLLAILVLLPALLTGFSKSTVLFR